MGWTLIGSWWTSDFGTFETCRADLTMSAHQGQTGSDGLMVKTALLTQSGRSPD
jgi:hypothetical protein